MLWKRPIGSTAAMSETLLSAKEAARRLGISVACFYDWLSQSDRGEFVLRGQRVTVDYFQGGARGQGRIKLDADEVERLKELMRVQPRPLPQRRPPSKQHHYPGITVELGDPGD